jgi:hypothetical protein
MHQETIAYLIAQHTNQLANGLPPVGVKFTTSIKLLCDATVGGLERCYDWLSSPAGKTIVACAWAMCKFNGAGNFNLSADYLTSSLAMSDLLSYLKTHRKLFDEILNKVGNIWGIEDMPDDNDKDEEDLSYGGSSFDDDTDVPMCAVVQASLGLDIHDAPDPAAEFCVDMSGVGADKHGNLVSIAENEQVLDIEDTYLSDSSDSGSKSDVHQEKN